jgi:hypothetical protein
MIRTANTIDTGESLRCTILDKEKTEIRAYGVSTIFLQRMPQTKCSLRPDFSRILPMKGMEHNHMLLRLVWSYTNEWQQQS